MDKLDYVLGALAYAGEIKIRSDDDAVDRLSRNVSPLVFTVS